MRSLVCIKQKLEHTGLVLHTEGLQCIMKRLFRVVWSFSQFKQL